MIIARLKGGLGNQMFQYAAGVTLAERRHVELKLDADTLATDPLRHYELNVFNIRAELIGEPERSLIRRCGPWNRRGMATILAPLLGSRYIRYVRDRQAGYNPAVLAAGKSVYLDGYWQSEKYFASVRPRLLKDFTFVQAPDATNTAMLESIGAGESVCVHVRRGDYVTQASTAARHGACGVEYYQWAFDRMNAISPAARYFVFSDEPAWAEQNIRPAGPATYVSHNTGKASHEDLRLMRHCRHFIIANSSFSWWAAWLNDAPGKQVIAPRPWFASPTASDKDLVPDRWIRPPENVAPVARTTEAR
jgi:hypothetical protein